jgi:hypothetical protein
MITGGSWEWLERVDRSTGEPTHAHIQLWSRRLGEGVYDMGLDEATFKSVMQRAAARGYHAEMRDSKTYHVRDIVLSLGAGQADALVQRSRLLEAHELPGAPLLATLLITDTLPFAAFPCGYPLHDARVTRALRLRVHPRASLVLAAQRSDGCATVVRGVHLEVALRNASHPSTKLPSKPTATDNTTASNRTPDLRLRACVEAAVHYVLLGQPTTKKAGARRVTASHASQSTHQSHLTHVTAQTHPTA